LRASRTRSTARTRATCWSKLAAFGAAAANQRRFRTFLAAEVHASRVRDAGSPSRAHNAKHFWFWRETCRKRRHFEGASITRRGAADCALAAFVDEAQQLIAGSRRRARIVGYGHVGEATALQPEPAGRDGAGLAGGARILACAGSVTARSTTWSRDSAAAFSAEHGIGRAKVAELERYEDAGRARTDAHAQERARPARHHEIPARCSGLNSEQQASGRGSPRD